MEKRVEKDLQRSRFPVVVHVALKRDDQLFLLRRAHTGFLDGYYTCPGGHQDSGEGVQDAAVREVFEETGVRVLDLEPVAVLPYRHKKDRGVNFLFQTCHFEGEPRINEPHLFDACLWAPADRLPEPCPLWLPEALRVSADGGWFREFV